MKPLLILLTLTVGLSAQATKAPAAKKGASICAQLDEAVEMGTPSQKLNRFFATQWKYNMTEYPEFATYVGYPGQNDRWSDSSLATIQRHRNETHCALAALVKIPRASLKGEERINFDLAKRNFEMGIEGAKFEGDYLVLDHLNGLHMGIADMLTAMPTANKLDYENMISRLNKVPLLEEQTEILMREGLKRKVTPVKMFLARVPSQFDRVLTAKIEDSPIFKPFAEMGVNITPEDKADLQKRAKEAIETNVYPALKKLKTFVVNDYIPGARTSISYADMPNGKAWYAYMVKSHTTTRLTPTELHDLGLKEVARITQEMEAVKTQAGFKGSLKAFNEFLLSDKQFYYTNKEELLKGFRAIAKKADPELPKFFKTLPRLTYGVREMPEYKAKESPGAYYEGGSLEAGRPGYFTANTYDLKARPKWGMEALTLHEGAPGHHFQISIAQEIKGLPEFRRFGGYTAYVEGWGLYSESLGEDMGFYKDPYSKYGQLSYEMWRAIRLVVDTGLHSKGWSRQQAIDYFTATMPKAKIESEVEVDRYITWPGQALAYKVGQLKFRSLREHAKKELGEKFDIREFHDQLLGHGPLPLDVLETSIDEWIATVKKGKNKKSTKDQVTT